MNLRMATKLSGVFLERANIILILLVDWTKIITILKLVKLY